MRIDLKPMTDLMLDREVFFQPIGASGLLRSREGCRHERKGRD